MGSEETVEQPADEVPAEASPVENVPSPVVDDAEAVPDTQHEGTGRGEDTPGPSDVDSEDSVKEATTE